MISSGGQISILYTFKVLAALDVHTARWIVEKCLKGDLIRGRTVLLVVSEWFLFEFDSSYHSTTDAQRRDDLLDCGLRRVSWP